MADPKDIEATKLVRREFNKRAIDSSRADIRVSHGVATVRGVLTPMRGAEASVSEMIEQIRKVLRSRPEIRDVVIDCIIRESA